MKVLFSLGQTVATPGALHALAVNKTDPTALLKRHVSGDWGVLPSEDAAMNEEAVLNHQMRIFSAYYLEDGTKVWVITEWDRSVTTLLLPEEY